MAIAPWLKPWDMLLEAGRTAEEQFALLERAHCVSAKGRADGPTVIALIDRTAREFESEVWTGPYGPPIGWEPRSRWEAIQGALDAAGYLDEAGLRVLYEHAEPESRHVRRIIAEVRSTEVCCPTCLRLLPLTAVFCGYCGDRPGPPAPTSR